MPPVLPVLQLQGLTELVIDRCFTRDLTPLSAASRLINLHLSYDCWAIMGVSFPAALPALQKLRLMAALQVGCRGDWSSTAQVDAFDGQRTCNLLIVCNIVSTLQLLLPGFVVAWLFLVRCTLLGELPCVLLFSAAGFDTAGCLHWPHQP